mgnify:CR=1 FL=1
MKEFPNIEKYLPKDSLDYQRLLSFQEKAKSNGYGEGHLWMACLAAFPAFLTPDLLYKIWLNFRHISLKSGKSQDIERMAVSDILLSTLVEEVAVEVFCIRTPIRTALLALLEDWSRSVIGNESLVKRLADFTLRYVRAYQMEGESVTTAIREAQEWNALAYFNPNAAALKLKKALSQAVEEEAKQKVLRISFLLSKMDEQFKQLDQQEQQEQFRTLVDYSQGMQALIRGKKTEAVQAFKDIQKQGLANDTGSTTGKKVQLPIPKEIYQAIAAEDGVADVLEPKRFFALLIGIGEYGKEAGLPSLRGVQLDLEFWNSYFSDRIDGQVQINTLRNGAATKAAVVEALELECRKAEEGDQLFFFFSGYGQNKADGQTESTLLLHDYIMNSSDQGILSESEFRRIVEGSLPPGAGCTLMLDTHSGGRNWVDIQKAGRYIYNATDIDERAIETQEGGLLTRAFRQVMVDIGAVNITHIALMRSLRALTKSLSTGQQQTPTWFGRRDHQETPFLHLPGPANLRLRELMVETGLAQSIQSIDVPAVLDKFRQDYSIDDHLSVEKALSIWASTGNDTFKVFISQSGQTVTLQSYLEDILFDKNIPNRIFTHDLQREIELQMQKARVQVELDWSIQLVDADFIILLIDEEWIKDPITEEVVALLELRLMESQVPYALLHANICQWREHPVSRLGELWPADSIVSAYEKREEKGFTADLTKHLSSTIDYIECFLGKPTNDLSVEMLQGQLLERIMNNLGRFYPKEVAQLESGTKDVEAQLSFIRSHFPAPIGQAIEYLLAPKANSEQLPASLEVWHMLVHTLNTFLLALIRQLVKRGENGLKQQLEDLNLMDKIGIQDWLSQAAASAQFLEMLQSTEQLFGLLEELGLSAEAWQRLTGRDLPSAVSEDVPPGLSGNDRSSAIRSTLTSNYSQLMLWLDRFEILVNVTWDNLCQLYSSKGYSSLLFHDQGLDPFQENSDFYRLRLQEGAGNRLYFTSLAGQVRLIENKEEDTLPIWQKFQDLLPELGYKKEIPTHPQQVHSLLVGINNYPSSLPSLRAPENDILQFRAYLDRQPLPAKTEMLSGAVTKANILETLSQAVEKAEVGDAVIFYFSGLGQKEQSPRLNDTIPAILTYDQQRIPIDEIVYLLCRDKEKALQPIIILDMGVNSNLSKAHQGANLLPKGIDAVGEARDWERYQFGDEIQNMEAWGAFMQEASFVLMVGCDYDNETALEDEQGSFFTRNLIEVLSRSRHYLPYPALQERLTEVLRHQVSQTPDIRVEGPTQTLRSPNFLGQASPEFQPLYGRVEWNRRLQKWTIDMGSRWGLSNQQIVHISNAEYQGNALARISFVYEDFSTLAFGDQMPDRSAQYLGFVDEFLQTEPLRLSIEGHEEETNRAYMLELGGAFPEVVVSEESEADFIFQAASQGFLIRPAYIEEGHIHEASEQELVPPFSSIKGLINKIAQAKALTSLSSADISQDPFAEDLSIELLQIDEEEQSQLLTPDSSNATNQQYQVDFEQLKRFQIQVKNQTTGRRYIAILLIRNDLGISNILRSSTGQSIQAGEMLQSRAWRAVLPITKEGPGKPSFLHTIKIIVSDQAFTSAYWLQSGLSIPNTEEESGQIIEDTNLLPHDNLWSISTIRIESGLERAKNISLDDLKLLMSRGKMEQVIDELYPVIPEDTDLFQRLVSTGSRYFELQRLKTRGLVEAAAVTIQEKRIDQGMQAILLSKELQDFLAKPNQENRSNVNVRRDWFKILLKQGTTEALYSLSASKAINEAQQKECLDLLEVANKNSLDFSTLLISVEDYLVQYSRQLAQLIEWANSLGFNEQLPPSIKEEPPKARVADWEIRKKSIRENLTQGDNISALQELRQILPAHQLTQQILLLQANQNLTIDAQNRGTASASQTQLNRNRASAAILNIVDHIERLGVGSTVPAWNGELQQKLVEFFLKGDLDASTVKLLDIVADKRAQQQAVILLRNSALKLESDHNLNLINEEEYWQNWNKIGNDFLDLVRQLDLTTPPIKEESDYTLYRPADLTLTLDRRAQHEQFIKVLMDQPEGLQIFFVLAPPKSVPQHLMQRLAWDIKPDESANGAVLETIFCKADTPLHRLSNQLEKEWQVRMSRSDIDQADRVLASIQFSEEWFEYKDELAAWFASEGGKREKQFRTKQLIAVVILESPPANAGSSIGRFLRGDPLQKQLNWLEESLGRFPNAHLLPTLGKINRQELANWLQALPKEEPKGRASEDSLDLKEKLANGQTQEVIDHLQDSELADQHQEALLILATQLKSIERSQALGVITAKEYNNQTKRVIYGLLDLIDELESPSTINLDARDRAEILKELEEELGNSQDGYHMEDVLRAIHQSTSLPIQPPVLAQPSRTEPEEKLWDETIELGNIPAYQNYLTTYPKGVFAQAAELALKRLDRISLIHESTLIPNPDKLDGKSLSHSILVQVNASSEDLATIEEVTYYLHHSFKNNVISKDSQKDKFALQLKVWGIFTIKARVRFLEGSDIVMERELSF